MLRMTAQWLTSSLLLVMSAGVATAAETGQVARVDGMEVYYGLLPAEISRGQPTRHIEKQHGGVPRGRGQYHLIVSVFDAKTGKRIENATVSARVGELALAPQSKMLEPMQIAGTVTFGNFFTISRPHGGTPHKLYSSTATCGDKAGI